MSIQDHLRSVFVALPFPCMLLDADLVITEVSGAYAQTMDRSRAELVGRYLFDAFPLPEDAQSAAGTGGSLEPGSGDPASTSAQEPLLLVRASMQRVLATGHPDPVPLQKYDIPDPDSPTGFQERWWSFTTFPVTDTDGAVTALLHVTEDVTKEITGRRRLASEQAEQVADQVATSTAALRGRAQQLEADLYERAVQVQLLVAARESAATQMAGLARTALALAEATTVTDLASAITDYGLATTGCNSGAVAVFSPNDPTTLDLTITDGFGAATQRDYARLPADSHLPACMAATTGQTVLLADAAASRAWGPEMDAVMTSTGSQAFACLPLSAGGRRLGSLTAGWRSPQPFDTSQVELLEALAAQCAQALDRLLVREAERVSREAERAASAQVARFSETLQRSLLTAPPQPDHLQIEVRYTPATAQAQVGGDWYDAFITDDGTTSLVIGDVTGHDQRAAAVMAQMRNLLRGIGYTVGDPPALVLSALDRAVHALGVDGMATVLLAQIEQDQAHRAAGTRVLHWSNAGHPAPLLLEPGRTPRFLETPPDLLVGLDPETSRDDHRVVLEPGATVLMFTDGLIERRGTSLEEGTAWLAGAAAALADLPLQELCDELLAQVAGQVEDDVALLAMRAHPEDGPRPVEAGPGFDPREVDTVDSEATR